jgi:hypothetical protein
MQPRWEGTKSIAAAWSVLDESPAGYVSPGPTENTPMTAISA